MLADIEADAKRQQNRLFFKSVLTVCTKAVIMQLIEETAGGAGNADRFWLRGALR